MRTEPTQLISSSQEALDQRFFNLRSRFNILLFIAEHGVKWPIAVLTQQEGWTTEQYVKCYQGENN